MDRSELDTAARDAFLVEWRQHPGDAIDSAVGYCDAVLDACLPLIDAEWEQVGWWTEGAAVPLTRTRNEQPMTIETGPAGATYSAPNPNYRESVPVFRRLSPEGETP